MNAATPNAMCGQAQNQKRRNEIATRLSRLILRLCLAAAFAWEGAGNLAAQSELIYGDVDRPEGEQSAWYFDTLRHVMWRRLPEGDWITVNGRFADAKACGKLIVTHKNPNSIEDYLGIQYWRHYESWNTCECQDSIAWAHDDRNRPYVRFYDQMGNLIAWSETDSIVHFQEPQCYIGGEGGFYCSASPMAFKGREAVHGWGVLGTHGRWLIPPQYDEPFRFQNGFANVKYYGLPRKIDETGAFVE